MRNLAGAGVAVSAAGEFRALIDDPRPVQDKAADAFKRAEEMVEMLEDRGIEAETPGRELVRPVVPPDLYDKYLDPAASKPPPPMTTTYAAEPRTYAASPPPPLSSRVAGRSPSLVPSLPVGAAVGASPSACRAFPPRTHR